MRTDWKLRAAALAPDIPQEQVERFTPILERMDSIAAPLMEDLPPELLPGMAFLPETEPEA